MPPFWLDAGEKKKMFAAQALSRKEKATCYIKNGFAESMETR